MLEYSAFAAPQVMEAYNATSASKATMSIWRLRLRDIERAERAAAKAPKREVGRGPQRLQPHVPWI